VLNVTADPMDADLANRPVSVRGVQRGGCQSDSKGMSVLRSRTLLSALLVGVAALLLGGPVAMAHATVLRVYPSGSGRAGASNTFENINIALAASHPGDRILVDSGSYPAIRDMQNRSGWVTVEGMGSTPPVVEGALMLGTRYLRLKDLNITGQVQVNYEPVLLTAQPAEHIVIEHSRVSDPRLPLISACVQIRHGARHVLLEADVVEQCGMGVGGGAQTDAVSSEITIQNSLLQNFEGWAFQFARWSDVEIVHNDIRGSWDPHEVVHNDNIIFTGGDTNIKIIGNLLSDSRDTQMLLQDSATDGIDSNVAVEDNLMWGSGGYAVQSQGVTGARFINNTIWDSRYGAILLRGAHFVHSVPTDTVVINNVLDGLDFYEGGLAASENYNAIAGPGASGTHDVKLSKTELEAATPTSVTGLVAVQEVLGDASYMPASDLFGVSRLGAPEVGAGAYDDAGEGLATFVQGAGPQMKMLPESKNPPRRVARLQASKSTALRPRQKKSSRRASIGESSVETPDVSGASNAPHPATAGKIPHSLRHGAKKRRKIKHHRHRGTHAREKRHSR
jgi:hypothetical protein